MRIGNWLLSLFLRLLFQRPLFHRLPRLAGPAVLACVCCFAVSVVAQEKPADYVPEVGKFPPANTGHHLAGELVTIDPINRRGGLRLDGDLVNDRYDKAPLHRFAMLPYGMIWYHGAPAELRDIPSGTHVHGTFYLPPAGDKTIPPPTGQGAGYIPPYTHALLLEDDFSFYQRQGQAWKITAIDLPQGLLKVVSVGQAAVNGLTSEQTFHLDGATRVWQGREFAELANLAVGQVVQLNLTWTPEWANREFHCLDIWIDPASRAVATEQQRRTHLRYQHHRWLAGWIDGVDQLPGGAGQGIVTITLFGGMDGSLYEEVRTRQAHGFAVAVAEATLRTWWQDHDNKSGRTVELKELPNPPLGSSGIQLRVQFDELLEGYRPNRFVRLRCSGWPNVKLPPEERVRSLEER